MTTLSVPSRLVSSRARSAFVAIMLLVTSACSKPQSPTGPTPIDAAAAPSPALTADNLTITAFTVTGQFADGQYRYWPELTIKETTGTRSLIVTRINFLLPGAAVSSGDARMTRDLPAGGTWTFGRSNGGVEFRSASDARQATVTVSFVDVTGRAGDVTASADVPPFPSGNPAARIEVSAFTVTRFIEQSGWFGYWPKLTVTETGGASELTITRIKFQLLGIGANGNIPTVFGSWRVPAGGSLGLFHELFYGEPAFYMSSTREAEEVSAILSFVDGNGRAGDVVAVARVSPADAGSFLAVD